MVRINVFSPLDILHLHKHCRFCSDFFRSLAIPVTSFYNLVIVRCDDVSDRKFQEDLRCAIVVLRQCLPMLATALQMAIKYPDKQKAIKGRDYCVNQVGVSLQNNPVVWNRWNLKISAPQSDLGNK